MTSTRQPIRQVLRAALRGDAFAFADVDAGLLRSLALGPSLRAAAGRLDVADVARAQMLLVDLARAVALLDDAGIPSVVMKGGALLASGRVPPGARHCDDVDLLVPAADAGRALATLEGQGFRVVDGVLADGTPHRDRPTHQLPMLVAPGGTPLELHVGTHVEGETFADVVADAVTVDVDGVAVRVPAPGRLLRQLCAHVVVHHAGEARLWPRHLFDLRALADVDVDADHPAVRLSRLVLRGLIDDDAPPVARALARAFVLPSTTTTRALALGGLGLRAVRRARAGELGATLWPDAAHLRFTGDLDADDDSSDRRRVVGARLRRWRRLLGR